MTSFYADGEILRGAINASLNRPFIALYSYLPGYTFHHLSPRSRSAFDPLAADTPDRLLTLGKIIAADILVNNPDRVPSV